MAAVIGGADWIPPSGPTSQPIAVIAVNTTTGQDVDITPFLQPQFQSIVYYWIQGAGSASPNAWVQTVSHNLGVAAFDWRGPVVMLPQTPLIVPMFAAIVLQTATADCHVLIAPVPGAAGPIVGTLLVMGMSTSPFTMESKSQILQPQLVSSGNVVVGAASSLNVLPAPSQGQYYRVKFLSWVWNAAPAANTSITWGTHTAPTALVAQRAVGTNAESYNFPVDFFLADGIDVTNSAAVAGSARIVAELWPF